jgi:hypothetical protein
LHYFAIITKNLTHYFVVLAILAQHVEGTVAFSFYAFEDKVIDDLAQLQCVLTFQDTLLFFTICVKSLDQKP